MPATANEFQLSADRTIWTIGFDFEDQARLEGFKLIAGLDEVGRGCIAGPVVAAACILNAEKEMPDGLDDSKKLTPEKREEITEQLKAECVAYAIGQVEADEIDRINILEATKKAMLIAIAALKPAADYLLIDALYLKQCRLPQKSIIKGDSISASIAAASILAKTYRDDLMKSYDATYPEYGFAAHKGYGAATHYDAIRLHGACDIHRKSFKGVCEDVVLPTGLF
ncbi:MAG: ribonuclease HII [Pyrinomonadaceae bacterium]